jgi:cellulose synthase (UDP-forming)
MPSGLRWTVRLLVVLGVSAGVNYLVWRWLESVDWTVWWIAVPLVLAETYSLVETMLFGLTVWRIRRRGEPPRLPGPVTVDVFVTTYDEPLDLVMATAVAARAIRYPHRTWVLDDGARDHVRAAAEAEGIGYLTRGPEWSDRPRHAKAGNLNNALLATDGEFLLVLDADQVPDPAILDRTLGYFADPAVALVQTPQWFTNVDDADLLGSQAPLFYGPIQQGKDGWGAAYFCGSNAVLRREALMQLGIVGYVRDVERSVRAALRASEELLTRARREARAHGPAAVAALDRVGEALGRARTALAAGTPVTELTYDFHRAVDRAGRDLVAADLAAMQADLSAIDELVAMPVPQHGGPGAGPSADTGTVLLAAPPVPAGLDAAAERLARADWSPLAAIESLKTLVTAIDVDLDDEAQPVMPLATISVTEDMATSMRLHALGWRSVFHHEVLARGLAPQDLAGMLQQRLRWSQGTLQVMLRENPLVQRGLTPGQRLMYLATMWSYLSGFASVVFLATPMAFLFFGIRPVEAFDGELLVRLLPCLVVNQVLSWVVGRGMRTWRAQQYSLALFPLWIRACLTAVGNVAFGRELGFVVTPKTSDGVHRPAWRLIRPQLVALGLLVAAAGAGVVRLARGQTSLADGVWVNLVWVAYDLLALGIVVRAARYRGPRTTDGVLS